MLPLLFGSILVVAGSCLSFVLLRCLGCVEDVCPSSWAFFPLWLMFAPLQIMLFVLLIVCWILMGRFFCFEIGSWRLAAVVWLVMVFLWWTGGKGCPPDLVLKYGGPIAFDSRSGVSSLVQVWFWALLVFCRWTGGYAVVEAEWSLEKELGVGDEDWFLFFKGVRLRWVVATSVMDVVFSVVGKYRSQF